MRATSRPDVSIQAQADQVRTPNELWFPSCRAASGEHGGERLGEYLQIQGERPRVDVLQVQFHPRFKVGDLGASADLPETGETGFHAQATPLPCLVLHDF